MFFFSVSTFEGPRGGECKTDGIETDIDIHGNFLALQVKSLVIHWTVCFFRPINQT